MKNESLPAGAPQTIAAGQDRSGDATLRFGVFELDTGAGELRKAGNLVRIHSQPLRLLDLLARRSGELVTRDEIRDHLWPPGTHVEVDQGINACVRQVRSALGDSASSPRFVETVPRRGYRFLAPIAGPDVKVAEARSELPSAAELSNHRLLGLTLAALALVAGVLAVFWWLRPASPIAVLPPPQIHRPVLAILPFNTFGGEEDHQDLADGLTEELISQLGGRYPDQLAVIARTSAMTYRGTTKTIDEIASELGANYLLESSIRGEGDRLRITAQLIDATDQSHLWAENYDREPEGLLDLQQEISYRIAASLVNELLEPTPDPRPETAPEAYLAYLKGRAALEANVVDQTKRAREFFQQAVDSAPEFAPAYVSLVRAELSLRLPYRESSLERIRLPLARALSLDPSLAEAHFVRSAVALFVDFDLPEGKMAVDRSLELNPTSAEALHQRAGVESALGFLEQAFETIELARKLDPLSTAIASDAGFYRYFAGHWDKALRESVHTLELEPGHLWARHCIGLVLTHHNPWTATTWERDFGAPLSDLLGVPDAEFSALPEAYWQQRLQVLNEAEDHGVAFNGTLASVHLALGHQDEALHYLEQGIEQNLGWVIPFLRVHPLFQLLKGNPRFEAVLDAVRW